MNNAESSFADQVLKAIGEPKLRLISINLFANKLRRLLSDLYAIFLSGAVVELDRFIPISLGALAGNLFPYRQKLPPIAAD